MKQKNKNTKRSNKLFEKYRHKFRLVLINVDTFEEQYSMILTPVNVFTWLGVLIFLFSTIIISAIFFTPIREFIPGYADVNIKRNLTITSNKADSLEQVLKNNQAYIDNIKVILSGGEFYYDSLETTSNAVNIDLPYVNVSPEDSVLRKEVEEEGRFNLRLQTTDSKDDRLRNVLFFTPIEGLLSSQFNPEIGHFGVDVVAADSKAPIKSVLEGTVTLATWSSDEGYILYIQHKYNLVSVYKHNAVLLKGVGEKVEAGDIIAIVGDSGELSSGPHLHIELWHNGSAINPADYIIF